MKKQLVRNEAAAMLQTYFTFRSQKQRRETAWLLAPRN